MSFSLNNFNSFIPIRIRNERIDARSNVSFFVGRLVQKRVFDSLSEGVLKHIDCLLACSDLELKGHEPVSAHAVTVDHDSSKDGELAFALHPVQMENTLKELFLDFVHLVHKCSLSVGRSHDFL